MGLLGTGAAVLFALAAAAGAVALFFDWLELWQEAPPDDSPLHLVLPAALFTLYGATALASRKVPYADSVFCLALGLPLSLALTVFIKQAYLDESPPPIPLLLGLAFAAPFVLLGGADIVPPALPLTVIGSLATALGLLLCWAPGLVLESTGISAADAITLTGSPTLPAFVLLAVALAASLGLASAAAADQRRVLSSMLLAFGHMAIVCLRLSGSRLLDSIVPEASGSAVLSSTVVTLTAATQSLLFVALMLGPPFPSDDDTDSPSSSPDAKPSAASAKSGKGPSSPSRTTARRRQQATQ